MPDRRQALAAFTGALLASCNRARKRVIAVIPKGTAHLFWIGVRNGAEAAGKEFNIEISWNGAPSETDYARQIQIVDSMVAQHVDGIAVAAAEKTALIAPVERAIAAGIPVTVFDSGLDSTKYLSFVATDNVDGGRLGARTLANLIGTKGKVAMVANAPGSTSTLDREKGFDEVMAREFPGIQVVARQFGQSDRAKARAAAENILTAHPDLAGIFASAEPSSVGAALAIKSRNLTGKVKLVCFDTDEAMVDDLRGGTIDAMIVQDPFRMGYEAVKTIVDKLDGKTPPPRVDLHAALVKKEDLDKPDVKRLLNLK